MQGFTLVFDVKPVPKGRPRFTRSGFAYTPKTTRDYEITLKTLAIKQFKFKPVTRPIIVLVDLYFKKPNKPSKEYPRGDADNYAKAVLDALNGVVWEDDSQIVSAIAIKQYHDQDQIAVSVLPDQGLIRDYLKLLAVVAKDLED